MKTRASLRYFVTDCRQYHQTQDLDSTASALVSTDVICDQSKKGEIKDKSQLPSFFMKLLN